MIVMQDKATLTVIPATLRLARDHLHPLTPAEAKISARLRNRELGFKIRRQHPIWGFIADFYCTEAKLVIEIDGDSHVEPDQAEYDKARTEWLEERGYRVIRIMNKDVHRYLEDILNEIYLVCQERTASLKSIGERNSL
ncbi:MAG TPA: endonuclease domain-containing protein [Anaerolineales bacterium]|nr:endonuclease domain-containing protein [Anaerolineales bacterium]